MAPSVVWDVEDCAEVSVNLTRNTVPYLTVNKTDTLAAIATAFANMLSYRLDISVNRSQT